MKRNPLPVLSLALLLVSCSERESATRPTVMPEDPSAASQPLVTEKSDAEWCAQLTAEQYRVLRQAGTERPHGAVYEEFKHHAAGSYHCAGCDVLLFSTNPFSPALGAAL